MKSSLSISKFSKGHSILIISISLIYIFLNITGCALSRQLIRTHTGHGYGANFVNETYSNERDFFQPAGSTTDLVSDDYNDFTPKSECLVDVSSDIRIHPGNGPHNIGNRYFPTPVWPRGIFTTGTGIIVIVDLFE